jgi:transcriptional regulator with XRE-family HTH domain
VVEQHRSTASFPRRLEILRRLARSFADRSYRHAYMGRHLRAFLAIQMRALRGTRTQKEFGDLVGKPQSVISRLEKQADKNISIQTLIDIAAKLDVAVIIRFIDFPTFLKYTEDQSEIATFPEPYSDSQMSAFVATLAPPRNLGAAADRPATMLGISEQRWPNPLGQAVPQELPGGSQHALQTAEPIIVGSNVVPFRAIGQTRHLRIEEDVRQSQRYVG